jgi:hypothetical protein
MLDDECGEPLTRNQKLRSKIVELQMCVALNYQLKHRNSNFATFDMQKL